LNLADTGGSIVGVQSDLQNFIKRKAACRQEYFAKRPQQHLLAAKKDPATDSHSTYGRYQNQPVARGEA